MVLIFDVKENQDPKKAKAPLGKWLWFNLDAQQRKQSTPQSQKWIR